MNNSVSLHLSSYLTNFVSQSFDSFTTTSISREANLLDELGTQPFQADG